MALELTLTTLDGVPEDVAKEYTKQEDGSFKLDVTGLEDTGALKRAKEHEKEARVKAETKLAEANEALTAATEKIDEIARGNVSKGDLETIEASWQKKLDDQKKSSEETISGLNGSLDNLLVDNVAQAMASEISTSPELLMPHIKSRLKAEHVEGKSVTRVLDAEGQSSAITIEELANEFRANKKFAPIIVGSKASGSGAEQQQNGGGAPNSGKALDYKTASTKDIAADIKARKESEQ